MTFLSGWSKSTFFCSSISGRGFIFNRVPNGHILKPRTPFSLDANTDSCNYIERSLVGFKIDMEGIEEYLPRFLHFFFFFEVYQVSELFVD